MMAKEATGTERARQISVAKLKKLVGSARSAKASRDEINGQIGNQIRAAIENDNLHAKAFKTALNEDRMEPDKLADYYDALEFYRDVLGLIDRAKSAPRMDMGDARRGEEKDDDGDERRPGSSVVPLHS